MSFEGKTRLEQNAGLNALLYEDIIIPTYIKAGIHPAFKFIVCNQGTCLGDSTMVTKRIATTFRSWNNINVPCLHLGLSPQI